MQPSRKVIALAAIVATAALGVWVPRAEASPSRNNSSLFKRAAQHIIREANVRGAGSCVVFGAGEGGLARELARATKLTIVGMDEDQEKIARGRTSLLADGLYGDRVTLHHGSLDKIPYEDYSAALVVSSPSKSCKRRR